MFSFSRLALVTVVSISLGACASKGQPKMEHAAVATSAETRLKIKETAAGTTSVNLEVKHLAQPEKVKEGTSHYVVWAKPMGQEGITMNIGSFQPDKNLRGELESVTPYRKFQLFVTPESERTALQPSTDPVLWTDVSL